MSTTETEFENLYGIKACMEDIKWELEKMKKDPIRLLGEFTLRAKQDVFFNKTMIIALEKYIEEHGIKWNDRYNK